MTHLNPSVRFRNIKTGVNYSNIWPLLENGIWRSLHPYNYEKNVLLGLHSRDEWRPVIGEILAIFPNTQWSVERNRLIDPEFTPSCRIVSFDDFLNEARLFFESFSGKKIGVQLSGGLDSSIIIGLLRYFGMPHALVGMTTDRYEFRTERLIQNTIAEKADTIKLLNYEDFLPFSSLNNLPPFQHPDASSNNFSDNNAMAMACKSLGIEVLLTGNGGDVLLANPVPNTSASCKWRPQTFNDGWLNDIVYTHYGVTLLSFFSHGPLVDCLFNLRRGQGEDTKKLWARDFFRAILPEQLTNFTYCADFWGLYIDGLNEAISEIHKIHENAYFFSGNSYFKADNFYKMLKNDLLQSNKRLYQKIEARISMATWLNALRKTS